LLLCLVDLTIEPTESLLVQVQLIHQRLVDLFRINKLLLDERFVLRNLLKSLLEPQ
jgi:hypothetical protein